ncbi:MAG TPA: discoidin domain-containing protein, partial [Polyangia bacterium]|nr:discoidin domain-containing protein [Polyangia bacterium]
GGVHPGKLASGSCNIPFGGNEVILGAFEVLLTMPPAKPINPYDRTNWTASASSSTTTYPPKNAFDGDRMTRWGTGQSQVGNEWFRLDLGAPAKLRQITLNHQYQPWDFPVKYTLELSADDITYNTVATGMGSAIETRINIAPTTARYIRIRQGGQTPPNTQWWSIGELTVVGE